MQLVLNPDAVLNDPAANVIYNVRSGERYEASKDTLSLLALFAEPTSPERAVAGLDPLSENDRETVLRFIEQLGEAGLLIQTDEVGQVCSDIARPKTELAFPNRTMFSCPGRTIDALSDETIVFVGSTFDLGSTGYPGSRYAPDRIRELSSDAFEYHADICSGRNRGWHSYETDRNVLAGTTAADIGNVLLQVGEDFGDYFGRLQRVMTRVISHGSFPVLVGGDHSITYAAVKAFDQPSMGIIHIDAHTDLGQLIRGISHNHGNVFTRLRQEGFAGNLVQLGIRSFAGKTPSDTGYKLVTARSLQYDDLAAALEPIDTSKQWYVTIDVDVLNPAFAPGVGTPVTGGLSPAQLNALLSQLANRARIVGCDLVEVNPMRDLNDATSILAIEVLLHFLGEIFV